MLSSAYKESVKYGVVLPNDLSYQPKKLMPYVQAINEMGFDFITVYDQVALPYAQSSGEGAFAYLNHEVPGNDPFMSLAIAAAADGSMDLFTSVLIPGIRRVVHVARLTSDIQNFSDGHLHLGVGPGGSPTEYAAVGRNFSERGKILDEQLLLLKELWSGKPVTYSGQYEHLESVVINPIPEKTIPLWGSGKSQAGRRRTIQYAEGWMDFEPDEPGKTTHLEARRFLEQELEKKNRDPNTFKTMVKVGLVRPDQIGKESPEAAVDRWRDIGVSHIAFSTNGGGKRYKNLYEHIIAINKISQHLPLRRGRG